MVFLLAAALLAAASVRSEHTESFAVMLAPEQGSNTSSSGTAHLRIINSTDQGVGFARYRVVGGALLHLARRHGADGNQDVYGAC